MRKVKGWNAVVRYGFTAKYCRRRIMSSPGTPVRPIIEAYSPAKDKKPVVAFGAVLVIVAIAVAMAFIR